MCNRLRGRFQLGQYTVERAARAPTFAILSPRIDRDADDAAPRPDPARTQALKLRQTQAGTPQHRPSAEPGIRPLMSASKMYVCRRCRITSRPATASPIRACPAWQVLPASPAAAATTA